MCVCVCVCVCVCRDIEYVSGTDVVMYTLRWKYEIASTKTFGCTNLSHVSAIYLETAHFLRSL